MAFVRHNSASLRLLQRIIRSLFNITKGVNMGEAAEMLLDGTMCETCGQYLGKSVGYPRSCCDETHYNYGAEIEVIND